MCMCCGVFPCQAGHTWWWVCLLYSAKTEERGCNMSIIWWKTHSQFGTNGFDSAGFSTHAISQTVVYEFPDLACWWLPVWLMVDSQKLHTHMTCSYVGSPFFPRDRLAPQSLIQHNVFCRCIMGGTLRMTKTRQRGWGWCWKSSNLLLAQTMLLSCTRRRYKLENLMEKLGMQETKDSWQSVSAGDRHCWTLVSREMMF